MSLQPDKGFTRIVNEVLEQLVKTPLLGSEFALLIFVIRKTWGYHKREDFISLTQFEKGLNLSRPTITKTIKNLVLKKMLVKGYLPDKQGNTFKFNKYWREWLVNPPQLVKDTSETSKEKLQKLVKGGLHTKETTKENKKEMNLENTKAYKQLKERFGKKI